MTDKELLKKIENAYNLILKINQHLQKHAVLTSEDYIKLSKKYPVK